MADYISNKQIGKHPLIYFDQVDSTNRLALELGLDGQKTGTIVLASDQSKGRGRLGKAWLSSPGDGLYFSVILRPRLELAELARITLVAGLALAEAADLFCQPAALLKWPNDLLLAGKKCAGILAESDLRQQQPLVILGIGVNVYQPAGGFGSEIAQRAGALQQFSSHISRGELLHAIIERLDWQLNYLQSGGWQAILHDWQQRDATKGRNCTWLNTAGTQVRGVSQGVDGSGQLYIVDEQGQRHAVLSGDVQLNYKQTNKLP